MDIDEEEVQVAATENIFNKIIAEKFPNIERLSFRCGRILRLQTDNTRKESRPHVTL
jgi:hypothetical protein